LVAKFGKAKMSGDNDKNLAEVVAVKGADVVPKVK